MIYALPALAFCIAILIAVRVWLGRRRSDPYDLKRLWDEPLQEPDDIDQMVDHDAGPYCHSCDEPHAAGTSFCRHCGRKLG